MPLLRGSLKRGCNSGSTCNRRFIRPPHTAKRGLSSSLALIGHARPTTRVGSHTEMRDSGSLTFSTCSWASSPAARSCSTGCQPQAHRAPRPSAARRSRPRASAVKPSATPRRGEGGRPRRQGARARAAGRGRAAGARAATGGSRGSSRRSPNRRARWPSVWPRPNALEQELRAREQDVDVRRTAATEEAAARYERLRGRSAARAAAAGGPDRRRGARAAAAADRSPTRGATPRNLVKRLEAEAREIAAASARGRSSPKRSSAAPPSTPSRPPSRWSTCRATT